MLPRDLVVKVQKNVDKPCFWKFLSPRENWKSKSMRIIPEEFVKSTSGAIEHGVVFSVCWGNSWHLWLEQDKNDLVMTEEDWDEFVDDNHLGPNDNLFFRHDDSMFLEVQIFKNDGEEIVHVPLEVEPKTDSLHLKHQNSHKETTTASAFASEFSAKEGTNSRAIKGCVEINNPEQYLKNPENVHFVKTVTKRNDVLYVPRGIITTYNLKFGPHMSSMNYILPDQEMKGLTKWYSNGNSVCFNGWTEICRNYNLKIGDSVVCELESTSDVITTVRIHFINK